MRDTPAPAEVPFAQAVQQRAAALQAREAELESTMRWLWEAVAEPVLQALGWAGPKDPGWARRVWWCPTGLLTLLPIHGAGYHDGTSRAVLDCVVSSYTPTLRALAESRRRPPISCGEQPALFVGMPATLGQLELTDVVARERAVLGAMMPGGLVAVEGATATVAAVSAAMERHSWVHMSCHGQQDLSDPTRAGFVLADGSLTVSQLGASRFAGELAYLSACRTGTGGIHLADEVITLGAALSYAGFRHVIGTLWTVRPAISATVAEAVYPALVHNGVVVSDRAAAALHHAVRSLRDGGTGLADWLPFVHYGP
ncbi:CHAT domain-containing protein [Rhizocola hellebori]|uniref:CHAT domain-containing protein n=1 Tax=Rhizocola hellebori TaxID=1392758 RepID=UPI0019444C1C|nr:CHAT domain-containing protein [Rhizocola hellebori]